MIYGIGTDIIEVARVAEKINRSGDFKTHVFSNNEIEYCESKTHKFECYAARFAAKEAFLKAEQEETIRIMKQMTAKKLYKDIKSLQAETISVIEAENADILKQIETLQNQLAINNSEIEKINRGDKNDELIQAKVDIINLSIIKHI